MTRDDDMNERPSSTQPVDDKSRTNRPDAERPERGDGLVGDASVGSAVDANVGSAVDASVGSAVDVGLLASFADQAATRVVIDGVPVAVVRIGGEVFAIGDICTHAKVSLSDGEVWCEERELECPKHGSPFSLTTGVPSSPPATRPVPVFDARVIDGKVMVTTLPASPDPSEAGRAE